ncbi:hypothetical protein HN512_04110 [Candidatus Peregrinibacteria bacterium]|jgi:hypothetical protein|nr:hypothetical protein [Candidatus Peregrinibacteria bacterium]MBT3598993.1 hypothetical protein [Candidatus Peregrinibacteria bacterium]MBT4366975.1 hypothetical protein [Candidatus Peregrinibacteria bacterium]MBT4585558.1 hypothetical protein [Candidatus Peregrinibacteria bacterium]MBT6731296.1 hypothetical protein [Candidatus Peregrinibacteria bacterium]
MKTLKQTTSDTSSDPNEDQADICGLTPKEIDDLMGLDPEIDFEIDAFGNPIFDYVDLFGIDRNDKEMRRLAKDHLKIERRVRREAKKILKEKRKKK